MPATEFAEWVLYIARNPSTAEVVDWQLATFMSLFHSANRAPGQAVIPPKAWSLYDQLKPQTEEERIAEESLRIKRMFGVL